jgi:hypothetical protein
VKVLATAVSAFVLALMAQLATPSSAFADDAPPPSVPPVPTSVEEVQQFIVDTWGAGPCC